MSSESQVEVLFDRVACDRAFYAGQLVERLLLDRAAEVARKAGSSTVTTCELEACFDDATAHQLIEALRGTIHGKAEGRAGSAHRRGKAA